ncbi:uncharacterized protein LOC128743967 [Sabethes cyaneus]|uniref:uncharacterized protein LOC128743967 n=1 Tax=Sabethes cyaneus TaxID=53552 RepID=UPI00237D7AEC|nr:uncharacterized protein LOC128743967 [Sabethes cyaneus]
MGLPKKICSIILTICISVPFCFAEIKSYSACLTEVNHSLDSKFCEAWDSDVIPEDARNAHMKCALKSFGWTDSRDEFNVRNILDDARAVTGDLEANIKNCARKANRAPVRMQANQFIICMLGSDSKGIFQTIFDLRALKALDRWKNQSFTFKAVADATRGVKTERGCF